MTNQFLNFTFKYNNFIYSQQEALIYLKNIYNNKSYDLIDYEKFIYIDVNFSNNNEIQYFINKIKQDISNNWFKKQQFINRLK